MSETHEPYTTEQKKTILTIARNGIVSALRGKRLDRADTSGDLAFLEEPRGCFVTLHDYLHRLRGCIGNFDATHPLVDCLIDMGAAVIRDPRFVYNNPVTLHEMPNLEVEVSVLTPLEPLDDPTQLRIGVDGIYIKGEVNGQPRSGCFLPQVAVEQGWDVEQTLSYCCAHKMGVAPDAWRAADEHGITFSRFQSIIIAEREPGSCEPKD